MQEAGYRGRVRRLRGSPYSPRPASSFVARLSAVEIKSYTFEWFYHIPKAGGAACADRSKSKSRKQKWKVRKPSQNGTSWSVNWAQK
jgi:hypothetical protein